MTNPNRKLNWKLNAVQSNYDNWLAETPFGQILITWKSWKPAGLQGAMIDEFPGEIPVYYGDPIELRDQAEARFWELVDATYNYTGE